MRRISANRRRSRCGFRWGSLHELEHSAGRAGPVIHRLHLHPIDIGSGVPLPPSAGGTPVRKDRGSRSASRRCGRRFRIDPGAEQAGWLLWRIAPSGRVLDRIHHVSGSPRDLADPADPRERVRLDLDTRAASGGPDRPFDDRPVARIEMPYRWPWWPGWERYGWQAAAALSGSCASTRPMTRPRHQGPPGERSGDRGG